MRREPRRILSIVSNTATLKGFPVGFFAEEMTRAFLMFTEAGHRVDLASPRGGEVMYDTHSDPRTPGCAYADDLISLGDPLGLSGPDLERVFRRFGANRTRRKHQLTSEFSWRQFLESRVRTALVVIPAPRLDDRFGFAQRFEPM